MVEEEEIVFAWLTFFGSLPEKATFPFLPISQSEAASSNLQIPNCLLKICITVLLRSRSRSDCPIIHEVASCSSSRLGCLLLPFFLPSPFFPPNPNASTVFFFLNSLQRKRCSSVVIVLSWWWSREKKKESDCSSPATENWRMCNIASRVKIIVVFFIFFSSLVGRSCCWTLPCN